MKLDYELVRDIMLTVEALQPKEYLAPENCERHELLKDYDPHIIRYTIERIKEAGYIPASSVYFYKFPKNRLGRLKLIKVYALTWQGHQFLNHIRHKSVLEKIKYKFTNMNDLPVNFILAVAEKLFQNSMNL